jgi:hypothetical protein
MTAPIATITNCCRTHAPAPGTPTAGVALSDDRVTRNRNRKCVTTRVSFGAPAPAVWDARAASLGPARGILWRVADPVEPPQLRR